MEKCIILSRVSTQGQSLESQTELIVKEAVKSGFSNNQIILIEEKESAIKLSEEERRGLTRLKEAITNDNEITHVFIYELSRLSRRQTVLFSIRDFLIEHKVQLVCMQPYFKMLDDNSKLSQTANLMFSIFASMAESEMELKRERLMRGRLFNKANGKNGGHPLLFGYKSLEDHTIVVDEEKAEAVRWLFETYAEGKVSLGTLANKYKQSHKNFVELPLCKRRMGQLLTNKKYCGDSEYPAIISKELFDKCRDIAKSNISGPRHTGWNEALLKRIIFDDKGRHMTYSHCKRERYMPADGTPSISRASIDNNVWELAKMLHDNYVDNKDTIRAKLEEEINGLEANKLVLMENKMKIQDRIDALEERIIFGRVSKDKAEEIERKIYEEANIAEEEIKAIDSKLRKAKKLVEDLWKAKPVDYDLFDTGQKIALIRQMIEKVVISKPCRAMAVAKVFPKVGSFMYELEINVMTKEASMTSRMCLDDVKKSTK